MSLKKLTINTGVLSGVKIISVASQFVILPIIARYLSPADLGTMALAMVFITFSTIIADFGIGGSLLRQKDFHQKEWLSAFWFIVFLGVTIGITLAILSPAIAWFFNIAELKPMIMTLAIVPILQSLIVVPQTELQRRGDFFTIAMGELVATFVGFGIAIWFVVHGDGVWSLIYQQITFWCVRVLNILFHSRIDIYLHFSLKSITKHLTFGRDAVAFGMVSLFRLESQHIFIGKFINASGTGIYSMANRFALLPGQVLINSVYYILYTNFTSISKNRLFLGEATFAISRLMFIAVLPPVAILAASSEAFFTLFLSEKWADVSIIFMIIGPVSVISLVSSIYATVLMATGETTLRLRIAVEATVYWLVLLSIVSWFGIKAVAIAYAFWVLSYLPRQCQLFLSTLDLTVWAYLKLFIRPTVITAAYVLVHLFIILTLRLTRVQELLLIPFSTIVAWVGLYALLKHVINTDIKTMRGFMERKGDPSL